MIDFLAKNAGMIGLLFFFCVFVGVAIWAYWPTQKKKLEAYKFLPLKEEDI
ncbi:MAG: cbb3-type cytochrome c oxidase subunit 3 [Pseudomonadota bacterium]